MLSSPALIAKRLGVSPRVVYKAIRARRFAAVRIFGDTGPVRVFTDTAGRPVREAPPAGTQAWMSLADVASALDVTPRILQTACREGRVEGRRTPGGLHWRIRIDRGTGLPVRVLY